MPGGAHRWEVRLWAGYASANEVLAYGSLHSDSPTQER